jgi:uncharacterized damage-inducible protein DinB
MSAAHELLEQALNGWIATRAGTIAEIENLQDADLDFRVADGARTVREAAVHILRAGALFAAVLTNPAGNFMQLFDPAFDQANAGHLPTAPGRAELAALLRQEGEANIARIRAAADLMVDGSIPTLIGQESRISGLHFAVAHEMYHRGQLALCARACGRIPALTQRIMALVSA